MHLYTEINVLKIEKQNKITFGTPNDSIGMGFHSKSTSIVSTDIPYYIVQRHNDCCDYDYAYAMLLNHDDHDGCSTTKQKCS